MESDSKLIGILSLLVVILGIAFTLRITIFKDDGLSSTNTNLATTNTLLNVTETNSISTTNTYSNTTTNNNLDITNEKNELSEREEFTERAKKASKELQNYEKKEQVKNGILYTLSSLIIAFLVLSALYYIFKKYNFTTGLIAYSTYAIISSCIQNGFHFSTIFLAFIVALIETIISYVVYTKSNSFRAFLGKLLLVGLVIFVVLVILGTIIAMINGNNGILSKAQ